MTTFILAKRERLEVRGYCTGPAEYGPAVGKVGLDYRADCVKCGKRVKITVRGNFANHKPKKR